MEFHEYKEIIFEDGKILSKEMLEETYSYPREFLRLTHANFHSGIICGLDFIQKTDGVHLTSGIVKIDGKYYALNQDVNLDDWLKSSNLEDAVEYNLYMIGENILAADDNLRGIKARHRLSLDVNREKPKEALFLAKYKFFKGYKIPLPSLNNSENPFEEFFGSGKLQLLNCEYAHPQGGLCFHPLIFRAVQEYLEKKNPLSPYDFSLLIELQNRGIVADKTLISYVSAKKDIARKELLKKVFEKVQEEYNPIINSSPSFYNRGKSEDNANDPPGGLIDDY